MPRKTRVAVVGVGEFGRNHVRVVRESPRAELAAVVDTDAVRASEVAAANGCPAFTDALELAGKVDAAIVAVPTSAHADAGCALLESGIDVLVEKPIAPDLASADQLNSRRRIEQPHSADRPSGALQSRR